MDLDLRVGGGRLRARRHGASSDRLVLAIPGLTANLVSMERIAEAAPMVALDLRGRGFSEVTGPGTYGWGNHARDVLEAATALGAERFALVGWSMGAFVGMATARLAPERIERLVLIDALGPVEDRVVGLIEMSVNRLGTVYPSVDEYLTLVRSTGLIRPWDETWERYFAYELADVQGGVAARTNREAALEDMRFGQAQVDMTAYWAALTMPTLLIRAQEPLLPGTSSHVVTPALLDSFRSACPHAEVVEVAANHYGIGTHPDTVAAVRRFLA